MTGAVRKLYSVLPWRLFERALTGGEFGIIALDPLVLYAKEWVCWTDDGAFEPVLRRHRSVRTYLLLAFSWHREGPVHIRKITAWFARHRRRYPNQEVLFLANTELQQRQLHEAGLQSEFVSSNAFVDETVFKPLSGVSKRFDAIYDARLSAFKRHPLAAEVSSLALIAARNPRYVDPAYERVVKNSLAHAHWYNDPTSPAYRSFESAEVNACLNECCVGLALSAEEGAMFASIQYLLAGLPVVSTRSRGGRDVFFDPDYVALVDDDPRAVADGVRRLRDCAVEAADMRARTLDRLEQHRERLYAHLDRWVPAPAGDEKGARDWKSRLRRADIGRNHLRVPARTMLERLARVV